MSAGIIAYKEEVLRIEKYLEYRTTLYIVNMVLYMVFTGFWIIRGFWFAVGFNYIMMTYVTHDYQKYKWLFFVWRTQKVYDGFDLKKAGED
jgi:hypothetical protein